ncbi:MAG: hypothetical protein GY845_19755 [Planctomycetes bacterium]|nr:hypothetical protein [Planctomycetota bacterium]
MTSFVNMRRRIFAQVINNKPLGVIAWNNNIPICDNSYGKSMTEMLTPGTFLKAGWDFVDETENGTEDILVDSRRL